MTPGDVPPWGVSVVWPPPNMMKCLTWHGSPLIDMLAEEFPAWWMYERFWSQVAIAAVLMWNDVVMQDGRCGSAAEGEYFCHKCRLPR